MELVHYRDLLPSSAAVPAVVMVDLDEEDDQTNEVQICKPAVASLASTMPGRRVCMQRQPPAPPSLNPPPAASPRFPAQSPTQSGDAPITSHAILVAATTLDNELVTEDWTENEWESIVEVSVARPRAL